ncbi:MAG: hypothetical protein JXL80_05060 [Planctomycetes bacterium]|nr:hypothetical protein [Planctomycetota bacterium]
MRTRRFCAICAFAWVAIFVAAPVAMAAVDKVICVPWQGDPAKQHTAINNVSVKLKGVIKTTDTTTVWYKWVYGDGSESAVTALSGSTSYNVEAAHTYLGAVGTPFTGQLMVDDVDNTMVNAVIDNYYVKIEADGFDARVNIAIDNGLWYLHKAQWTNTSTHSFNGEPVAVWSSYSSYYASPSASAVLAFEINGHYESGNEDQDPYVTNVKRGLNWLFNGYYSSTSYPMLQAYNIAVEPGGDPDVNGNGKGIEVRDSGYNPCYEGGMIMDAIIASHTPDKSCGRDFDGDSQPETYREVIQDMVDMYSYGQYDSATYGGWRYGWEQGPDNSACQWAAIGMIPAEQEWDCTIPQWVKNYNNGWLTTSYNVSGRYFGYTGTGAGNDSSIACRPSGMVQMVMSVNDYLNDSRWIGSESWFVDNWAWFVSRRTHYGWYAFVKAMRLSGPDRIAAGQNEEELSNGFNWYRGTGGMGWNLINTQESDGSWPQGSQTTHPGGYGDVFVTAWSIGMLKPALFAASPIASFTASPNPTYSDYDITFDPTSSGHSAAGKDITNLVLFQWDWDNNGIYDESYTTPQTVIHQFHADVLPSEFPVTLRVTDDDNLTATYTLIIRISNPPHPPVAHAGGPYIVSLCPGDTITLDGSRSYDPNEGTHEAGAPPETPNDTIIAWDWDFYGAPFNYTDGSGETVPASYTLPGTYNVGLRVTDNTELSFPSSLEGNLTDEDFTTAKVYVALDPSDITASIGCHSVILSWDTDGTYDVIRSTTNINTAFTKIGTAEGTSFVDTDVVEGQTYHYRLVRENDNQMSCAASITYVFDFTKCILIDDLVARAKVGVVLLTWSEVPGAVNYHVYRSTSPDVECIAGNEIGTSTSGIYYDTAVVNGTPYYYKVGVEKARMEGVSNEATATPPLPPPEMTCTAALDHDWVYQNQPAMTKWRHKSILTITLDDPFGLPETPYAVTVTQNAASTGDVVIQPTADKFVWEILGSEYPTARAGHVVLDVTVRTLFGRRSCNCTAELDVILLGDINQSNEVSPTDLSLLIMKLNNMAPPGYTTRHFDIDGNGGAEPTDMTVLINILNGILP